MTADPATTSAPASPESKSARLGELLVSRGKLSARDLDRANAAREETGGALGAVLISLGLVSESDVAQAQAHLLGLPFVPFEDFPALAPEMGALQSDFLRTHHIYPLNFLLFFNAVLNIIGIFFQSVEVIIAGYIHI